MLSNVTRSKFVGIVVAIPVLFTGLSAAAQDMRAGRYTMHKADDGFVRLDTETGAVSLCEKTAQGWGCKPMDKGQSFYRGGPTYQGGPNNWSNSGPMYKSSPPYDSEIAHLRKENEELKAEVKRLDELLGLREEKSNKKSFKLPTEKEVDQALGYFERMLKKLQDSVKRLEQSAKPEKQSDNKPEQQL